MSLNRIIKVANYFTVKYSQNIGEEKLTDSEAEGLPGTLRSKKDSPKTTRESNELYDLSMSPTEVTPAIETEKDVSPRTLQQFPSMIVFNPTHEVQVADKNKSNQPTNKDIEKTLTSIESNEVMFSNQILNADEAIKKLLEQFNKSKSEGSDFACFPIEDSEKNLNKINLVVEPLAEKYKESKLVNLSYKLIQPYYQGDIVMSLNKVARIANYFINKYGSKAKETALEQEVEELPENFMPRPKDPDEYLLEEDTHGQSQFLPETTRKVHKDNSRITSSGYGPRPSTDIVSELAKKVYGDNSEISQKDKIEAVRTMLRIYSQDILRYLKDAESEHGEGNLTEKDKISIMADFLKDKLRIS